eukprot:Rmarinus@m.25036
MGVRHALVSLFFLVLLEKISSEDGGSHVGLQDGGFERRDKVFWETETVMPNANVICHGTKCGRDFSCEGTGFAHFKTLENEVNTESLSQTFMLSSSEHWLSFRLEMTRTDDSTGTLSVTLYPVDDDGNLGAGVQLLYVDASDQSVSYLRSSKVHIDLDKAGITSGRHQLLFLHNGHPDPAAHSGAMTHFILDNVEFVHGRDDTQFSIDANCPKDHVIQQSNVAMVTFIGVIGATVGLGLVLGIGYYTFKFSRSSITRFLRGRRYRKMYSRVDLQSPEPAMCGVEGDTDLLDMELGGMFGGKEKEK